MNQKNLSDPTENQGLLFKKKIEAKAYELVRDLEISNFIHGSIKKTALDKFMSSLTGRFRRLLLLSVPT